MRGSADQEAERNARQAWRPKLADPALYEDVRKGELETWNRKYAEVMDALDRAEAMWLKAQEKAGGGGVSDRSRSDADDIGPVAQCPACERQAFIADAMFLLRDEPECSENMTFTAVEGSVLLWLFRRRFERTEGNRSSSTGVEPAILPAVRRDSVPARLCLRGKREDLTGFRRKAHVGRIYQPDAPRQLWRCFCRICGTSPW